MTTKIETERRFIISSADKINVPYADLYITQTYLEDGSRVRSSRLHYGTRTAYTHTSKKPIETGSRLETEHYISKGKYEQLLSEADPEKVQINKIRRVFTIGNQTFELDYFLNPRFGLIILEAELESLSSELVIPEFLHVQEEITSDPTYCNSELAKKHEVFFRY